MSDYTIRIETEKDFSETENLTREAFWNVYRPGCLEHYVLHTFRDREDFIPDLSLVMEKDGGIIGHVMYVKSKIKAADGRTIPTVTFGPLSIHPDYKRKGYGKNLLDYSLEKAKALGAGAVLIEGNIDFYGKSGFREAGEKGIRLGFMPEGEPAPFFLYKELVEGYLDGAKGAYDDPDGYNVDLAEAEEFDKLFPPKEKLKLPGQLG